MRNYWLKIIASAFGIFAVGMLVITGVRSVKHTVSRTINSNDPIPIPLAGLVPFRLDDSRLGSLSRLEILRSDPEHVSGVRVLVSLADSISPERLGACQLALDDVNNLNDRTTFRCQAPGASNPELIPFGVVVVKNQGDTFPLLLPSSAVADLRRTKFEFGPHGVNVHTEPDPQRVALAERFDQMRERLGDQIEALSDSIDELKDRSGELEDSATSLPRQDRRRVQAQADSVRGVMRRLVDQMRNQEARLKALEKFDGATLAALDSVVTLKGALGDSVARVVARELRESAVRVEVKGTAGTGSAAGATGAAATSVGVEATAPPAPPAPAQPPR